MRDPKHPVHDSTEIRHLLRTVKTSLELAIMARAPVEMVYRLARVSGLLDAVAQLPPEARQVRDLTASLVLEGRAATELWRAWEKTRTPAA